MTRRRRRNPGSGGGDMDIILMVGVGFLLYTLATKAQTTTGTVTPKSCPSLEQLMGIADASDPCQAGTAAMTTSIPTASLPPPTDSGLVGLGRVYLSGMGSLGMIGAGYGINETFGGDASRYEMARKYVM